MVKRWFSFIGQEIRGLHEAAYLLAAFAMLSLILALIRDKLLAYTFGAGSALDVYYASFRIPDLIFATIGSLVSASILLPYFIEKFDSSREKGKSFSDSIFTVFFIGVIVVSSIIFFIAPWLIPKVIPGFANSPNLSDLILSTRIMLLSPLFLGLSNLFSGLTQMRYRFLVYALSPVVYNAGIIIGVIFIYPIFGIVGLAIGVVIGAILHMIIQVPFMIYEGLFPIFTFKIDWKDLTKILFITFPRTITLSINQLTSFVLVSIASLMASGSISVFNFAFNLQSISLTLIGASYSSAVFPTLSRLMVKGKIAEFKEKMITSAQHIIFWSMPLTVILMVLRAQIVRLVLGAGKFDWADTKLTAAMLAIFAFSTIGQSLIILFVKAFYSEGKTSRPLFMNIISAITIVALGFGLQELFLTFPVFRFFMEDLLKVSGQDGTSVLVLAVAFSVGTLLNLILHWWTYERFYSGFTRPVISTLFHSFAASVIMGYTAFLSLRIYALFLPLTKVWGLLLQGLLSCLTGLIVFIIILKLLNNKELKDVIRTLHRKIWKVPVPPVEVEHI